MKIGRTGYAASIQHEIPLRKPGADGENAVARDSVHTSDTALLLSRRTAEIKDQLLPRQDVLRKFGGIADNPLQLEDATIDQIIDRMMEI